MNCTQWTNQLIDKTQPTAVRVEAAGKLARECREYSAWQTLCSVLADEDDDLAVRCAVVGLLPDWNRYAAVNFLARAFPNEQIRAAAVATLEKIGPVEGEMQARMLAYLSALRSGSEGVYLLSLALQYGRDPRVLEHLREELQSPDSDVRAQAVTTLCCLGESAPVLSMASDASAHVRARLCTALGWYREQAGAEILGRLLSDSDPEVAKEAKKGLRLLGRLEMAQPGRLAQERPASAWLVLLAEISRLRLTDPKVAVDLPDSMVEAGWLGEPGASEEQIEAAERRLGMGLPPSYRQFLAESNGFHKLSPFIWKLMGTAEIDWFRTRNTEWIEAYQIGDDISVEEHLKAPQDSGYWRAAYLWSCLQISEEGDSAIVLLNPEVVTPAGEWEAWFFANWVPGAVRYRSFADYMQSELESAHNFSKHS